MRAVMQRISGRYVREDLLEANGHELASKAMDILKKIWILHFISKQRILLSRKSCDIRLSVSDISRDFGRED